MDKKEVAITRIFDAARETVFSAWLDPERMQRWWGPRMFTTPVCELDARPGGLIRIHMKGPDGVVYPMTGTFHEIVEPERIVMTTRAVPNKKGKPQLEALITATFTEQKGRTKLTVHAVVVKSTPAAKTAIAGMEKGWRQSLHKLAEELRNFPEIYEEIE